VSAIGSPTYRLAKKLAQILSPLAGKTSSFIKNSTDFANQIKRTTIQSSDTMVSFDVVFSPKSPSQMLLPQSPTSYLKMSHSRIAQQSRLRISAH